ncbi:arsenate reductase/protein-tyrosine-phosphatase family protein [Nocardia seriolae]|uniref:Protein tyrosine phosphatase n=1 Tax=Nocardia seriolae TaxID=37332 RepID=A0A0B8NFU0_9NOCA|nr:low molecular weight phosphatase family protein [Nocardia seriolae]APA97576.1 Protein-tyrosine-phosphatase [Nocardia seriolae]MTJ62468.1 low molecular weight phosphatase family protein [Nocardia seriolae]MTJ76297.1 low molecular weight phosphatase family protein [Nocardia seriolae]MTJ87371.1 low molecular weight phosphatase family protein [Nocardia seriolae]MTK31364.1 low molecular weight phosphatase family protein [Nocardia seriolae]
MHVLFVCSGNVCRSVIAERLTLAVAAEHGLQELSAESAGVRALVGFPVEPLAAQTIVGLGGNADNFKARRLKADMVHRADMVLTMTDKIRDQVRDLVPEALPRTFTLLEAYRIAKVSGARSVVGLHAARDDLAYVGRENIADPVGLSPQQYCEVGDKIAEALVPLLLALHAHQHPQATLHPRSPSTGQQPLLVIDGGRAVPGRRAEYPKPVESPNRAGQPARRVAESAG